MRFHYRHLSAVLAALMLAAFGAMAFAQQPTRVNPTESSVTEKQLLDALKPETPAVTGRITIPDKRASTLIQPEGREYEDWRRTTLPRIGAISIIGMLVVLLGFLAIRGRIPIEGGASGSTVHRFDALERFGHWLTATAFVVLGLSGLNVTYGRRLLMPLIGHDAFSAWSQMAKYLHNYMSFAFVVGLLIMFVRWVAFNIPTGRDVTWALEGGGLVGKKHPPAGRFNGGQKGMFWVAILGGSALAITGYALMLPFHGASIPLVGSLTQTVGGLQTLSIVHGVIAVLMVAIILAHIYIGTIGMEGAFWAMGTGRVDEKWARQHHSLWVDEAIAKEKSSGLTPAE